MKNLFIILLCLLPLGIAQVSAESTVTSTSTVYPELKTQIDKIFVSLEKKLANRTTEKQISLYNTLIARVEALQKARPNLSAKNKFLLQYIVEKSKAAIAKLDEDDIDLGDIFDNLEEADTDTTTNENSDNTSEESIVFTRKDFTQESNTSEMMIGRFEINSEEKIEKLTIRLASDREIDFSGKQSIKIQREDGINIALSTSISFEENQTEALIEFAAPFFIRAGEYKLIGNFLHLENRNYYTYVEKVAYGEVEKTYEKGEKKIALISVSREKEEEKKESGIDALKYEVDSVDYNLGAFKVYGGEMYFQNIEIRVSADQKIGLEKELVYILKEDGSIFAKSTSYRQDGNIFYVSFKNPVFKEGIYKINAGETLKDLDLSRVETKIGSYLLGNLSDETATSLKGLVLSVVETK